MANKEVNPKRRNLLTEMQNNQYGVRRLRNFAYPFGPLIVRCVDKISLHDRC